MQAVTYELAEEIYSILVETVRAVDPEDFPWRQWAFCHVLVNASGETPVLSVTEYKFDSAIKAKLVINDEAAPIIVIDPSEIMPSRQAMATLATQKIKLLLRNRRPRKAPRPSRRKVIPITTNETLMEPLSQQSAEIDGLTEAVSDVVALEPVYEDFERVFSQ